MHYLSAGLNPRSTEWELLKGGGRGGGGARVFFDAWRVSHEQGQHGIPNYLSKNDGGLAPIVLVWTNPVFLRILAS